MIDLSNLFPGASERVRGELVQVYSRRAVYVEGVRRIERLSRTEAVLSASCTLTVAGAGLVLRQLGDQAVCVEGRIDSVLFSGGSC